MRLMVKDLKIRTLVSGDKEAEIVLRTLYPQDIKLLSALLDEIEVDVIFTVDKKRMKD